MTTPSPSGVRIDGAKVRRLRKLAGQYLGPFAAKCGISLQYLSQIERGVRPFVSPPVFAAICDTLSIDQDRRATLIKSDEAA